MTVWRSPAVGLIGIGFYVATSIVGPAIIGSQLDRRFDSEPVLTLLFLVLGLLVAGIGAYRQLRWVLQRAAAEERRGGR
ncbi:MAG: AtpZ/AtpI family protein [Chloroflexi bacterium]|nr:AtpZ/AtpI family protein [Chloroflexota bacterium]